MGDIQGLADSIHRHSLLHPIIIDESLNLIAGHRRLEAHRLLGRASIETRTINDLSDKEKRLIELEENTKRKALTEYEASKNLLELVEATKDVLKEEFCPTVGQNIREGGRPEKPDSDSKVAGRIGVPKQTISNARQHVQAVQQFPVLEYVPKMEAIKTAKEPDKADLYQKALEQFPQLKVMGYNVDDSITMAHKMLTSPAQVAKINEAVSRIEDHKKRSDQHDLELREAKVFTGIIDRAVYISANYTEQRLLLWLDHSFGDKRQEVDMAISLFQEAINRLTAMQNTLRQTMQGPRKVK